MLAPNRNAKLNVKFLFLRNQVEACGIRVKKNETVKIEKTN